MKNYVIEVIKDLIISVLIIICIIVILSIVFYDKISLSKVIPEAEEYFLTEEMEQEIEDTDLEEAQEVIVNYYIDATDLKKYEKTNEYNKGKSNPFAAESYDAGETTNTVDGSASNSTNNTNNNFYNDEGIK